MISKHDEHLTSQYLSDHSIYVIKHVSSDYKQLCVFRISKATIESNKQKN